MRVAGVSTGNSALSACSAYSTALQTSYHLRRYLPPISYEALRLSNHTLSLRPSYLHTPARPPVTAHPQINNTPAMPPTAPTTIAPRPATPHTSFLGPAPDETSAFAAVAEA
jgi:hypothetical protein